MKKESQDAWVRRILEKKGKISRNYCLSKYVSRLGAIIFRLKESGMDISGAYVNKNGGRDFVYFIKR